MPKLTASGLLNQLRADLRGDTERGKLVRSAGMTAGMKIGATLLAFGASLLYARALGPHDYGLYAYVIAWAAILTIPAGLGLPQYLVREGAKAPGSLNWLRCWADKRILISGLITLVLLASAALIPAAAGARLLFIIAAPLPLLSSTASVRSALLQSTGHVARSQWPRLLLTPLLILIAFVALWLWGGRFHPAYLIIATVAAALLLLFINSVQLRHVTPKPGDSFSTQLHLREALPYMLVSGLYLINSRVDLIMLGSLKGAYDAGIYTIASRAAEFTSFLMGAGNMVLAPKIARLYYSGERALLQRMLQGAAGRILIATIPVALFLIIAANPLLTYFYGKQYSAGATALQILTFAQIAGVLSGPLGTLLNMTGHAKINTKNMFLAVALNVVLNSALIPAFGITGAAIATGTSLIFSRILLWYWVRRHIGINSTPINFGSR